MDWGNLSNILTTKAVDLITLGGKIHPYAGAAVALIIVGLLVWLAIKAGKQIWAKKKKEAGEAISNTGKEQGIAKKTQDGVDNFLGGGR